MVHPALAAAGHEVTAVFRRPADEYADPVRRRRAAATAEGFARTNPSGDAESQGVFTLRLAQEMRPRLGLPCPVELKKQVEFPEPRIRINTDPAEADVPDGM